MPMRATPADCGRFADLLDALADEELAPDMAAALRDHLAACPACAAEAAAIGTLRAELATLREEAAPEALRQRLAAMLHDDMPAAAAPGRRRLLALAAAGIGGIAIGAGGFGLLQDSRAEIVAHDLLTAHARALLAGAPPQIASGNPHQVRPWLSAHLPAAPLVPESEDFPLLGARLDLIGRRPVAAILYRRRAHAITVFATAEDGADAWPSRPMTRNGFRLLPCVASGIHYVAVSDLNAGELAMLADRIRAPGP
jgi:anti-sigma factor (TIGR02949 family)